MRAAVWVSVLVIVGALQAACSATDPGAPALCGSDDAVGFIGVQGLAPGVASGTPPVTFGADVVSEIGYTYVGISKSCEFWAYLHAGAVGAPGGTLYSGQLTEREAKDIEDMLQLEAWGSFRSKSPRVPGTPCSSET